MSGAAIVGGVPALLVKDAKGVSYPTDNPGITMINVNGTAPTGEWQPLYALFKGDVPSQLADLRSLEADFTLARKSAALWIDADKLLHGGDEESVKVVRRALWTSAVIAYRRGFTTGKAHLAPKGRPRRLKVPDHWKELLNPQQLEAHEEVLQLANQHIAHRVDEREHMTVSAILTPPPMPRAIAGFAVLSLDRSEPQHDLVERLGQLCTILIKILSDRSEQLFDAFKERVKSRDIDSLYENAQQEIVTLKVEPRNRP
jgi:hypothetical protein